MATLIPKRLQVQPVPPAIGLDRLLVFAVGELDEAQRKRLRGTVIPVGSAVDATRVHKDLMALAREAVAAGEVAEFLRTLDHDANERTPTGPTFAKFAEEWRDTCVVNSDLSESQVMSDLSILKNHLLPYFGNTPLVAIGVREVDRYIAAKRREDHQYGVGFSSKSINNQISVIHRIYERAVVYKLVTNNPVTKQAWQKAETTAEDGRPWWTSDEESRAVATLERWKTTKPGRRLAILTQLVVGLRFSELRVLEKKDLDLPGPGVWVRRSMARKTVATPKNKHARFHPIPQALADELQAFMLRTEGQLLFPSPTGGPLPNNTLNRWYDALAQEAGVRRITSHGARHTCGSSYALAGASQRVIATMLGHTDLSATARYTHVQTGATAPLVEARWTRMAGRTPHDH